MPGQSLSDSPDPSFSEPTTVKPRSCAARQRQFAADTSHELRSPLTRMRSELEVDLRRPDADLEATHRSVLEEVEALQALVEDLLLLARSDAGAALVPDALLDLDDIVLRVADGAEVPMTLELSGVSGATVRGDEGQLERVVRNLLDNAARHARSSIRLALEERDGDAILLVDDDGPGVAVADRERVFDRFTRLDDARSGALGGTGLGLAIVRDVVARHGGTVRVLDAPSGGARIEVRLPPAG